MPFARRVGERARGGELMGFGCCRKSAPFDSNHGDYVFICTSAVSYPQALIVIPQLYSQLLPYYGTGTLVVDVEPARSRLLASEVIPYSVS